MIKLNKDRGVLPILAIGLILMLISGGFFAAVYAAKAAGHSIKNLFNGDKVLRSLCCLAGIGIGGYSGACIGVPIGFAIALAIPSMGVGYGILLGGAAVGSIGAAFGAFATKYIAKGIAYWLHANELNPSNPEKSRPNIQNAPNSFVSSNATYFAPVFGNPMPPQPIQQALFPQPSAPPMEPLDDASRDHVKANDANFAYRA